MRNFLSVLCFFCQLSAWAQLQEGFADGDLTRDPAWSGDLAAFRIDAEGQLQSNGPVLTPATVQLATPCRAATGTSWEFYARLHLATSAGNYADVFLMSDSAALQGGNRGYFVRLGGTPDEVSLMRKDGPGSVHYVINGRDGTLGKPSGNIVRVKVSRDIQSRWTLWIDLTGTGQQYQQEGQATDAVYQRSAFLGVLLRYSAANSQRFFFDDFVVSDRQAPVLSQVRALGARQLEVQFNEAVAWAPAPRPEWFRVSNGSGPALAAQVPDQDPELLQLTFGQDFAPGSSQLTIAQAEDLFGNRAAGLTADFTYAPPVVARFREVRINEVLADTDPAAGLPEAEFIELYNPSSKTFDLKDWKYADATAATAVLPAYTLQPGAYLILCRATDTLLFQAFGPVLGLAAFPALNDGGDVVELRDARGRLIDRMAYTLAWYQDNGKSSGGWTLELINPTTPCGEAENFKAARHPAGGTPGQRNSVFDTSPDSLPPSLLRAEVAGDKQVRLFFSEALDSLSAVNPNHYAFSPALALDRVSLPEPARQQVVLELQQSLQPRQAYTLRVQQLTDCAGNQLAAREVALALPEPAAAGEVVINEVLFNPRPGGVDFVELVNRSPKFVDLKGWQLASQDSADGKTIASQPFILAPQQYLVLTTRPDVIRQHYIHSQQGSFLALPQLPAYPDEAGSVLLQNAAGLLIDRMDYHQDMHFALLDDQNGVSLERIRLQADSSRANWHSAASTAGYATPGYRNSQQVEARSGPRIFAVQPRAFTPDGDGDRDFATINYQPQAHGYMASITIYDAEGREVRRLVKNELLATRGFFQWDGLNEEGRKAPIGYYVLLIELYKTGEPVKIYRETVALGARF